MFRLAVLISGRGSNMAAILRRFSVGSDISVSCVLSDCDAPGLETAKSLGVLTQCVPKGAYDSKRDYEEAVVAILRDQKVDLVVLAGYMCLIGDVLLGAFPDKIINIHPSLLPSFKGLHPQQQALDAGVRFSGCTVHYVTKDLDSGPIIDQAVVPVYSDDTVSSLSDRILEQEHQLYPDVIDQLSKSKE